MLAPPKLMRDRSEGQNVVKSAGQMAPIRTHIVPADHRKCPDCNAILTPRGLAMHWRRRHDLNAVKHHACTWPHCNMRFFTKQNLNDIAPSIQTREIMSVAPQEQARLHAHWQRGYLSLPFG
ncbi:hypothetical protein CC1G_08746 [Coprinopsis cinerea okayama7|uniref:Uncharacterized protein n=1 Tax=Coprinopsis cinerea (strain Okayama-7 / 130 / ATCC MYA-4618 / FGSC 9003) TaxID=240176 RepID=A8NJ05_COPC7|nr:hypothetical protein CC1G_08746 [Coprinopsis cinerea okayama7\|eukprot:XP_001834115.2 hypothetical protein CC1G_08746 [Coprinopsis cinerea okayama7\